MILYTKLIPPQLPRHTLARSRIEALLREALDYRVTLLQASTGYGKSTALAGLAAVVRPFFWYSVGEGDRDPYQFLAHLIAALRAGLDDFPDTPLAFLHEAGAVPLTLDALLNVLAERLTTPCLLVLDDYHLGASDEVNALTDHFLAYLPPPLHVIVSTRYTPQWAHLVTWRARGQVLEIKRDALTFRRDEIAALFRDIYALALSPHAVEILYDKSEGWPIALQLIWQELRAQPTTDLTAWLAKEFISHDTLFGYLAQNVLAQQPPDLQDFLLQTAVLRELEPAVCNAVTARSDSDAWLAHLVERDLFVTMASEGHYRYHHLFHDFLRQTALERDAAVVTVRHRAAAEHYRSIENYDEALYHLLSAHAYAQAADLLEEIGENVLRTGRLDTFANWLDAIPAAIVSARPWLMFFLGDLARLVALQNKVESHAPRSEA
ncbi:MAG: hypothetical protein HY741_14210 [Chloroflexi bacterium]|nr:hypothetical protein [Chloroflexota bacterium]